MLEAFSMARAEGIGTVEKGLVGTLVLRGVHIEYMSIW